MDYNKLKYFVTVVEEKSLPHAARVLNSTQSAITSQVRKLEEELNTKLFKRIGKQIILTEEGQQIFELAKEKLGDIDEHVDLVISKGQNLKGKIRLGIAVEMAAPFSLFQQLARFRKKYPNISFEITIVKNLALEDGLIHMSYDMGIVSQLAARDLYETCQLSISHHFLITSKEYLEMKGPFTTIELILEADFIDFDLSFSNLKLWMHHHAENKIPALIYQTPALVVPGYSAAIEVVKEGHGIALLPEHLFEEGLKKGKLVKLLPQFKGIPIWLDLAISKSKTIQPYERLFLDFMKESTQKL